MRVVAIVTGTLVAAVALHRTATTASPRVVESDAAKQPEASPAQQSEQIVKVPAAIAAPMPQGNPQFSGDGMILPPEPHQSASVVIPELPPDPTIAPSPVTPRIAAPNPAAFNAVVDQVVATEVSKASQPKQVSQPAASNSVKPVTVNPPAIVAAQTQLEPTPSAEIDRVPIAVAEPQLIAPPQPEAIPMPLQSSRDSAPIPVPEPQSIAQTQPDSTPMPPSAEIDRSTSPEVEPQAEFVAAGKSLAPEAGYVLGAGDRIRVDVFGVPEYSGEYAVNIDGTVNLPLVGSLSLNGLDLRQAADRIATRYAPLLTRSTVNVNLVTARSLRVAVSGEVSRPGSYAIAPEGNKTPSMTRLLQLAGGTTRSANLRQVQVRRPQANGTDQLITVNLWDLLQTGNLRQDLLLRDGDSIFIPATAAIDLAESATLAGNNLASDSLQPIRVAVVGEVNRPGARVLTKEIKDGKTAEPSTVTQALQQAGGITQLADLRQVEIRRSTRSGVAQTIKLDLWELIQTGDLKQDLVLQEGDTILVPTATALSPQEASRIGSATFSPNTIKVNVVGEVARPGAIELAPNTPLNQAIFAAGGFTRRSRSNQVELIRLNGNGTVSRLPIGINLGADLSEATNPALRNGDVIVVDRSKGAKFSDSVESVLTPLGRIAPFLFLIP